MRASSRTTAIIVEAISLSIILLFVYAALSKVLDYQNFSTELGQSPILKSYSHIAAPGVLLAELLIAVLLSFRATRKWALLVAFSLMILFTSYIIIILNFSDYIPCSCGGVLQKLDWREHIIFNAFFILLAGIGFCLASGAQSSASPGYSTTPLIKKAAILSITFITSTAAVGLLYLLSETERQHENPFTRKFISVGAPKAKNLDGYGYYFAGVYRDTIWLGNHSTPLYITELDSTLHHTSKHKIRLDRYDFPYRSLELRVDYPNFFLFDGMVPVVYQGNIAEFKAKVVMDKNIFFTDAAVLGNSQLAIRGQKPPKGEHILGLLQTGNNPEATFHDGLLIKQQDGIFDTDGEMAYNSEKGRLIYFYYYRNEFIVTDSVLQLIYRGHTIDTITNTKLKIVTIKGSGDTKLASPPTFVNRRIATEGNLLFVHSMLRGQKESAKEWRNNTAIDVYSLMDGTYQFSFYIPHSGNDALREFAVTPKGIYTIKGKTLYSYPFGEEIIGLINSKL